LPTRFFDTPYYITPSELVGQEAFAVIREAMRGKGMVALGRLVLSKRERVIALEAAKCAMVLLNWPPPDHLWIGPKSRPSQRLTNGMARTRGRWPCQWRRPGRHGRVAGAYSRTQVRKCERAPRAIHGREGHNQQHRR